MTLRFHRILLVGAGLAYLFWWFAVRAIIPGAYNPIFSRLVVVACFFLVFAASFYMNAADINWLGGSYILIIAVCACVHSEMLLLAYCLFVLGLSIVMNFLDPPLQRMIFLPGVVTILAFAFFGMRARIKLLSRVEAGREALRIRDEFISIASHELRTPLTTIKIYMQSAKKSIAGSEPAMDPEKFRNMIEKVDKQADRLTRLVNDMLDVSRISMGKVVMEKTQIRLADIARDVAGSLADAFKQAGCEVELQLDDSAVLLCDGFRMEQVIINLLTNAMKYGSRKPISVRLARSGSGVVLSVRDQGLGIATENQSRIFQRFERAVSFKSISGLGLGLYICKQIVEAHQGVIEVESEPGRGACFTVRLPASAAGTSR